MLGIILLFNVIRILTLLIIFLLPPKMIGSRFMTKCFIIRVVFVIFVVIITFVIITNDYIS